MPRKKRYSSEPRVPPPYIDPDTDPEFLALDEKAKTLINHALDWMLDMDVRGNPYQRSFYIAEAYEGTDTEGKKQAGLSAKTIYTRYLKWVKSGRDWRSLDLYRSQRGRRLDHLETYGITSQSARDFCRRQGFDGVSAWAAQHGYSPQAVSRALSEKTPGKRSQNFYNLLIEAMRGEPANLHRQLEVLTKKLSEIQDQVREFSQRIRHFEKQLPPWM